MQFVTTLTFRDSKSTLYSSTREDAVREWNKAKSNRDVVAVSGGILCADVKLGSKTYTFYAEENYAHGTMVNVPTCIGNTTGRVMSMKVMTRKQLEVLAATNHFSVADHKTICGRV